MSERTALIPAAAAPKPGSKRLIPFLFSSSLCVLHKEPQSRALLAENPAPDGGDGVTDPGGNP